MVKTALLLTISIVALGFGTPAVCVYYSVYYGFNSIIAGLVSIASIIMAGGIGFFGIVQGPLGSMSFEGLSESDKRKLDLMRAHQRATLEELDEMVELLREIRDLLKTTGE